LKLEWSLLCLKQPYTEHCPKLVYLFYALTFCFLKIYFNIILYSHIYVSQAFLSLQVFRPRLRKLFASLTYSGLLILFYLLTLTIFSKAYKLWSNVLSNFSPSSSHFNSLRPRCSPQYPIPIHSQSMFFLRARDQVSCTHKATSRYITYRKIKAAFFIERFSIVFKYFVGT
jgi:hypothetical protein